MYFECKITPFICEDFLLHIIYLNLGLNSIWLLIYDIAQSQISMLESACRECAVTETCGYRCVFGFNWLLIDVEMHTTVEHQSTSAYSKHNFIKLKTFLVPNKYTKGFTPLRDWVPLLTQHKVQISVTDFEI